jgi:hypothetical protein
MGARPSVGIIAYEERTTIENEWRLFVIHLFSGLTALTGRQGQCWPSG